MKKRTIIILSMMIMLILISTLLYGQQVNLDVLDIFFDINGQYTGSLPELGRDEVEGLKWVHSDEEGGVIPSDICYVPSENLLFVYGDRRISVIDAISELIINTIDISDYGHWKYFPRTQEREKRIVYNPVNNKIYCATESMDILVINPQNGGQIEETISVPSPNSYWWMLLEIDEVNNNLYWGIIPLNANVTYLTVIDCTTNNILLNTTIGNKIYDMKKHTVWNKIYFAQDNGISVRQAISPYNEIDFYATTENIGVIEILYNEEQNLDTVVFCEKDIDNSSQEEIYILDETTGLFSSIDNLDFSFFSSSCYAKEENKLYLGYQQSEGCGIMILNERLEILDLIPFQSNIDDPCDILYNSNTGKVFCGSCDNMYVIDGESNNLIYEHDFEKNVLYRLALCNNVNKVFATNYKVYNVESFSGEGVHLNTINVGGRVYKACYNEIEMKIYFYEKIMSNMDNAKVYIFDIETESFEILEIGHAISDIEYNQADHLLYLSSSITDIIRIFDVRNNHNELSPIQLSHSWISGIKITPNNKIFCITKLGIEIWNLTNMSYEGYIPYGTIYEYSNDCLRTGNNEIYISLINPENAFIGRIYVIDTETNNVITVFHDIDSPATIIYDSIHDRVYLYQQNYFFLQNQFICINCQDYTYEAIVTDEPVIYLELAENLNKLYVSTFNNDGYIYEYSTETNGLLQTHQTTGVARVTKFNPLSNKLYVLIPFNFSNNLQTEIWTIDCASSQIHGMGLEQFERKRGSLPGILIDMVLDEDNNKLYFGTGHSNVAIIKCEETEIKTYEFPEAIPPDNGWKWLSFDILNVDPQANIASSLLFPISEEEYLDYALFKDHGPGTYEERIEFFPSTGIWFHGDHEFTSPYGYKFHTWNECSLTTNGNRCEATTTFFVAGENEENWIGYFLKETQHIYDAFGGFTGYLVNLTGIRGQHWAIKKENGSWPRVPYTISPGDMMIVYSETDIPNFSWVSDTPREPFNIEEPQSFSYEEESDYIPIFIQLDPEDLPTEIGTFLDDECKGATVVQDTSAQICAYIIECQGGNLEFEFYYGNREQNKRIEEYIIYDPETSKTEKGTIQIEKNKDCYYVSFRGDSNNIPTPIKLEASNYPNPFNPDTKISFSIPEEQNIELSVYNLKGQKVKHLLSGQLSAGRHSVIWEGKNDNGKQVSSGLYFYKLKTKDKILTKKMLLLK